jgi:hypothetical protein
MGSLVNVWTSAEAIGTSPQLRDDIHRVLSRANDAFEDLTPSDLTKKPLTDAEARLQASLGITAGRSKPSFCRIE